MVHEEASQDLKWHWYYIENDKFFWQSEKYKTFVSARENGAITLVADPKEWEIWIKEDHQTYNNWKSAQFGKYLSARDDRTVNSQPTAGTWERWND